jgi:hypothetical protein
VDAEELSASVALMGNRRSQGSGGMWWDALQCRVGSAWGMRSSEAERLTVDRTHLEATVSLLPALLIDIIDEEGEGEPVAMAEDYKEGCLAAVTRWSACSSQHRRSLTSLNTLVRVGTYHYQHHGFDIKFVRDHQGECSLHRNITYARLTWDSTDRCDRYRCYGEHAHIIVS